MDFQANYPIYLQIAEDVKRRIVIGELKPVTSCPPMRNLQLPTRSTRIRYNASIVSWRQKVFLIPNEASARFW